MLPQFLHVIQQVQALERDGPSSSSTSNLGRGSENILTQELKRLRVDIEKAPLAAIESALHELSWETPQGCFANTSGIVHILAGVREQQLDSQSPLFMRGASNFLRECDATKIGMSESEFETVCERLCTAVCRAGRVWCHVAALPLLTLLGKRLQLNGPKSEPEWRSFCVLHSYTMKVLLNAGLFDLAASLADEGVTNLAVRRDGTSHPPGTTSRSVMEYYFHCGTAYVEMHRYGEAMDSFSMVLSTPAKSAAAIQLEARKQHILCGLAALGDIPNYSSSTWTRIRGEIDKHDQLKGYLAFARKIQAPSAHKYIAEKSEEKEEERLEKQLYMLQNTVKLESLLVAAKETSENHRLIALTNTYVSLPLADLYTPSTTTTSSKKKSHHHQHPLLDIRVTSVEDQVVRVIENDLVSATIDFRTQSVRFADHQTRNEKQEMENLEEEMKRLMDTCRDVGAMDARIAASKKYLKNMVRTAATITPSAPQENWTNSGSQDSP